MHIQRTIEIRTEPQKLWNLLTDGEQMKQWIRELVSTEPNNVPVEVGGLSHMKIKEGSRTVGYTCEVKACEPHSLLELELRGGSLGKSPMRVRYDFDGALLHYEAEWKPQEFTLRLLAPVIKGVADANADKALDSLKSLAEAS